MNDSVPKNVTFTVSRTVLLRNKEEEEEEMNDSANSLTQFLVVLVKFWPSPVRQSPSQRNRITE